MILNTKYQLVFIGADNPLKSKIIELFFSRIEDLGLKRDSFIILDRDIFRANYVANAPTVCIYFGSDKKDFTDIDVLEILMDDATFILPVVSDLKTFSKLIPKQLLPINGTQLVDENDIIPLVNSLLEGLSLLRVSRRLFISYRRNESSSVAIQLYERLEKAGFHVFLDTHSLRPGDPVQEELWHNLADTDVVVLLNTKDFLGSIWTQDELAKANAMSIGIVQLIWPDHVAKDIAKLSEQISLSHDDFINKKFDDVKCTLVQKTLEKIVNSVESLRARALGARQDNLVTEFISSAKSLSIPVDLHPEKFITIERSSGKEIIVLPTVGVPHAFRYNQSEELLKKLRSHKSSESYLLYDHLNIREKWLEHLSWLDKYLPLKSVKINEIDNWLKSI